MPSRNTRPGFGGDPRRPQRPPAHVEELIEGPERPKDNEPLGVGLAILFLFGLIWVDYLFGGAITVPYLAVGAVLGIIIAIFVPRDLWVSVARLIAFVMTGLLLWFLFTSGLPLAGAEAASPIAQHMQDDNGNLGNTFNLVWVGVMAIAATIAFFCWWTKKPWLIIMSGVLYPLACFPFIGMLLQEAARVHP